MKQFSFYITELFDKSHPWKQFSTGGGLDIYLFAFGKVRGGKMLPCPMDGNGIEKFYEENGLKITGRDEQNRPLLNNKKDPTPLPGVVYEVGFHNLSYQSSLYAPLKEKSNLSDSDMGKVYELYFQRMDSILKYSTQPIPVKSRWYWDYDRSISGGDEDLGIMSGADAAMVLATVLDISKAFVSKNNPKGILIGTKSTAKDARGRIYIGMAKRNAGQVITIPYSPRDNMKNANMIWLDKTKQFDPLANYKKM
jgi:hypothetical protein